MNKFTKTILISLITIFSASLLFVSSAQAVSPLKVDFEETPLFSEANFLPGESVLRHVDVTNNSGETKKIGLNIINDSTCSTDCLSDVLELIVSENGSPLHSDSLTNFYGFGEQVLSDLGTGGTKKYYFSITFNPIAGNNYQNSSTNFDIEIGFFGEESISDGIPGDGGAVIISGLKISNEIVSEVGANSATITWDTNKQSTSRVIYSPCNVPYSFDLNQPPKYGYLYSTSEYDTPAASNGLINGHTVDITGLLSGTTYYYRCISHASPDTISVEYKFVTKGAAKTEEEKEEGKEGSGEWTDIGGTILPTEGAKSIIEGTTTEKKEEPLVMLTPEIISDSFPNLLSDISDIFGNINNICYVNFPWLIILIFIIYPILLFIFDKEEKRKKEIKLFSIISIIIISILFLIWMFSECLSIWIIFIAILLYLFLIYSLKKK